MNDERPIEKLLRRYAKKRRDDDGEPLAMHPATRRLLQGEVARQFAKRSAAGDERQPAWVQILIGWRAHLIWAVPVVVVLGVGLWALVGMREKSGDQLQMAKRAPAPAASVTAPAGVAESFQALETDRAMSPAPAASPSSPPAQGGIQSKAAGDKFTLSMADAAVRRKERDEANISGFASTTSAESQLKRESGRVAANELARAATPPEARSQTPAVGRSLAEPTAAVGDERTKTLGLALAASPKPGWDYRLDNAPKDDLSGVHGLEANQPAAVAPDASGRYYRQASGGSSDRDSVQVYSQAFANRLPASGNEKAARSAPAASVLANFQVEQSGNQLRVIDGDGSTYVGDLNTPVAMAVANDELRKKTSGSIAAGSGAKPAALPSSSATPRDLPGAQDFGYRVAGTNRTLNQPVVFTWNFVALTNGLAAAQTKIPASGGNVRLNNLPAQQLPMLLNNSRISGRAQLGGAKEIEINAVPVSP